MEFDDFIRVAEVRIRGIEGLEKIAGAVDFKKSKNEKELHRLFDENPRLINPTFFEFLICDEKESVLATRLAKKLQIGKHAGATYKSNTKDEVDPLGSNKRPDLVTLLGNDILRSVVIIEFKAPNTPLHSDHYTQLEDYMRHTREWLEARGKDFASGFRVSGYLIGSKAESEYTNNEKVRRLADWIANVRNRDIRVMDVMEVLNETKTVHRDLINATKKARSGQK